MYFIKAASSISHQPTFRNKGFSKGISSLAEESSLLRPDYKEFISADVLRRMSEIIRMSIACSMDCLQQAHIGQPNAIIIGTGLGCLFDTEKFLANTITINGALIPPTSFIQSTHNTVAGQISLVLKNHDYNMTHTQNTLSFEYALMDACLNLDEGKENILVGAMDENIKPLKDISDKLGFKNIQLTSGASLFVVSKNKNNKSNSRIRHIAACGLVMSESDCITDFLQETQLDKSDIDLILFSGLDENTPSFLAEYFKETMLVNYIQYCGTYFTNSAFAFHLAQDILETGNFRAEHSKDELKNIKRILVYNKLNSMNLGLTILEAGEA
jgi:3-oxoacyl-[acyl-carrier-protein] synthase II